MFFKLVKLLFFLLMRFAASEDPGFIYNGFREATILHRDGAADITPTGLLRLTNETEQQMGHAFYMNPIQFKNPLSDGNTTNTTIVYSFSTTFVFAIVNKHGERLGGNGLAFFVAPPRGLPGALPSQYLGLFNRTNDGNSANHVFAVELDTLMNSDFEDINNNHVGIDINGLTSIKSAPASYFTNETGVGYRNLSLTNGEPMQIWVEYYREKKQLDVTLAPFKVPRPNIPLLSLTLDLSPIILDHMYVGFSAATGSTNTSHYILGWSFKINGQTQEFDLSRLPKLPRRGPKKRSMFLKYGLPIIVTVFGLATISGVVLTMLKKRKFADLRIEEWELNYRSHRFLYKDLYIATKGFRETELIGIGGFGRVYKGVLPTSKIQVAVKRVSHDSKQGMKEFIAEIISIGQLRHRNLVQLLGYCRREGELLLVYDLMPNGSLDKFLFGPLDSPVVLDWNRRFRIIKGVAYGLLYLHEECEQVVIHRDVKSSNVLLDGEMNAGLSDFGLARLHDRESNPQTTFVAGTVGYIAPELTRTGKASTSTDVFAFGAFLLEVACGRRPIELKTIESSEDLILFDWVFSCWKKGSILETSDPNLGTDYVLEEMELILKLGLLCSHTLPTSRPSMKQVVQYLEGDALLPASEMRGLNVAVGLSTNIEFARGEIFEDMDQIINHQLLTCQMIKWR